MKIGTLTFHRTTNYGGVLQAYALQKCISNLNYDINIINYNNIDIYSYYDYRVFYGRQSLKTRLGKIVRYGYNKAVYSLFEDFWNNYLSLSQECTSKEELKIIEEEYDVMIVGSDQIWNPNAIFKDFNAFLLEDFNGRKISYAASAGNIHLWDNYLKIYWNDLHNFDYISVRESQMIDATCKLSGKEVSLVLDPTLLLNCKDWKLLENKVDVPKKYILIYYLGNNQKLEDDLYDFYKKTGLQIISIGKKLDKKFNSLRPVCGPREFLYLFHNASYIFTSSFHGTVFSIQYQKQFVTYGNGGYNSRMETLLNTLELNNHLIVDEGYYKILNEKINWEKADKQLTKERKKSLDFILNALNSDERGNI